MKIVLVTISTLVQIVFTVLITLKVKSSDMYLQGDERKIHMIAIILRVNGHSNVSVLFLPVMLRSMPMLGEVWRATISIIASLVLLVLGVFLSNIRNIASSINLTLSKNTSNSVER